MTEASVPHDPKMTPDRATAELNRLTEEYRKSQIPPGESIEAHIARLSQDKRFAEAPVQRQCPSPGEVRGGVQESAGGRAGATGRRYAAYRLSVGDTMCCPLRVMGL